MFYRARRIGDIFIPLDQSIRKNRGFAFICFTARREADRAIELAMGRSWGGKKIRANLANVQTKERWHQESLLIQFKGETFISHAYAEIVKATATSPSGVIGWILEEGGEKGVCVAPWEIKKETEALFCSIVWRPKSDKKRLREAKLWLDPCWGKSNCNPKE